MTMHIKTMLIINILLHFENPQHKNNIFIPRNVSQKIKINK